MSISGRVLLVEDSADDEALVRRALRIFAKVHVDVVRDGEDAVRTIAARAGAGSLDLVLLDLKLPKLNGLEVLERLQEFPAVRALPVVVFSSHDGPLDEALYISCGANGVARKSTRFDEMERNLRETVAYWLGPAAVPIEERTPDARLVRVDVI